MGRKYYIDPISGDKIYIRPSVAKAQVKDVKVDGTSVVDSDRVANIDSSNFGKVDDVRVNGNSVTQDKVANIDVFYSNCKSEIARWLRFNPSNKKGLIIKAGTAIKLNNGKFAKYDVDTAIDLSSYVTEAGKDYFVYLSDDKVVSAYTSYQSNKGVKIGRFHTLCVSAGTITAKYPEKPSSGLSAGSKYLVKPYNQAEDPDFYNLYNVTVSSVTVQTYYDVVNAAHPLNGFNAGDILPESVFCLSFHPETLVEDAMVYDKALDKCIDIYLQSGTGYLTRSAYNATHTVSRQPINHQADMIKIGKKLLTDNDFLSAAIGSNEATNITGSSDKGTVGGHVDTAGRRMISAIGCEEMCGYLWQWLDEIGFNGQGDWQTYDGHASFGQTYGMTYVLIAGGAWDNGSACGSRSRSCADSRSLVAGGIGSRGSSSVNRSTLLR